ncbi:MAG TPA: hypothetical protein VIC04_01190 [Terriglobia bacterium]
MDLFVYVIGDRPVVMRAMVGPRLTPWAFRVTLGLAAGEGSGLAPSGALRGFQFLPQPLVLFLEPLQFLSQALGFIPGLVALPPSTTQFLREFPNAPDRIEMLEKQIIL